MIIFFLCVFCAGRIFSASCGDVNSSGGIDIVDALLTAQYYVGLNPQPFDEIAAEVSGDGMITIVDALLIAQYYVGLITSFSGCSTDKLAIVFMVAGQSNAKGAGVLSPAIHEELGHDNDYELMPGSTALEVGLPINADDYTHSYIWAPDINSFERIDPGTNTRVVRDAWNLGYHGMELPVVWELEKRFPDNDIYVIKWGVSATELFNDWNPERSDGEYATFLSFFNQGMTQLQGTYTQIRVVGLYWDQGESDGLEGKANVRTTDMSAAKVS